LHLDTLIRRFSHIMIASMTPNPRLARQWPETAWQSSYSACSSSISIKRSVHRLYDPSSSAISTVRPS